MRSFATTWLRLTRSQRKCEGVESLKKEYTAPRLGVSLYEEMCTEAGVSIPGSWDDLIQDED